SLPRRTRFSNPVTRVKQSGKSIGAEAPSGVFRMKKTKPVLKLGLPKGSLEQAGIEEMAKACYHISVSARSYVPYVDDEELEIRLIRAQEVSRYVEHGYLDCASPATIGSPRTAPTCMRSASFCSASHPAAHPVGPRRAGEFARQISKGSERQTCRDRGGELDEKVSQAARREGGGRIFLGRDRSQGTRAGRCDRRDH